MTVTAESPAPSIHQALTMLVHGYSKVGKSLLAASTPPPRVYFDVESAARFLPLRAVTWDPRDAPPDYDGKWDTCVIPVREWQDAVHGLDWLKQGQHPFRSASVDSISELQYRNVEKIAGRSQVQLQHWGQVLRETGGFVRDLRDLTMHPTNPLDAVVITAMSKLDKQGILRPHLQGQLGDVIPYLLDVCGYLFVDTDDKGQEIRRLLTRRRDAKEAGERVGGKIPPLMNLPVISGQTDDEVIAKNITFQLIMKKVFAAGMSVAAPAVQEPLVAGPSVDTEEEQA
jgi:AAA domain